MGLSGSVKIQNLGREDLSSGQAEQDSWRKDAKGVSLTIFCLNGQVLGFTLSEAVPFGGGVLWGREKDPGTRDVCYFDLGNPHS